MINIIRDTFNTGSTKGKMYINGEYFCYTLEDAVRTHGLKIYAETAIPEGVYKGCITKSNRFKRDMILIYNKSDFSIQKNDIRFDGIRCHGGNKAKDSAGCILVAHKTIDNSTIQGTAEKELTSKIKELYNYDEFTIVVSNKL